MKVTAKILDPIIIGGCACGLVIGDSEGRFKDLSPIKTSTVTKISVKDGVTYLTTLNSVYEVEGELKGTIPMSKKG